MARVLVLTLIFSPDNVSTAQLISGIAGDLKTYGHDVCVITTTPHYHKDLSLEKCQPLRNCFIGLVKKSLFEDIPVYHIRMPDKHCNKLLRVISWGLFHLFSTIVGLCIAFKPDVILTPSPPLSMGINAYILARLLRTKYIYNVQELYPDIAVNLGIVKSRRLIACLSTVERFIYNHAAAVTTITDSIQEKVKSRIRDNSLVYMIPNFVDEANVVSVERDNDFSRRYNIRSQFVVTYAGNLGAPQNLWMMVHAAILLRKIDEIVFLIIGDGTEKTELINTIRHEKLSNILVIDYQPMAMMPYIYAASDVFFVGQIPSAHSDGIPSKIYRIFGNKKPILAVTTSDSDLAKCVKSASGGVVVSDNSPNTFAEAILSLKESPKAVHDYGLNGYRYVQEFSKNNISRKYEQLIVSICRRRSYE